MSEITIRPATIQDLPGVAALLVALKDHHRVIEPDNLRYRVDNKEWYEVARRSLLSDRFSILLAEIDGVAVGMVKFFFDPKPWGLACQVDTLVVAEGNRSVGIGRALMQATEELARLNGAGGMRVEVLEMNEGGRAFYEREGYRVFAIRYGKPL